VSIVTPCDLETSTNENAGIFVCPWKGQGSEQCFLTQWVIM